jgi:hypothetical protein
MPLRAAAFHESVSVQRLDELFRSPTVQMFSGTTSALCPKCQARFAVFFSDREDTDNQTYLDRIKILVSENCKPGRQHSPEIHITE